MGEVLEVAGAGMLTALATGIGVVPVALLGTRAEALRPLLWGLAAGVMTVASVAGLLLPAFREGDVAEALVGLACGVAFLIWGRRALERRGALARPGARMGDRAFRRALLVAGVLTVHSLPEGFAVGTAWAAESSGLALFVVIGIAIQNVPEGTVTAIPMEAAGAGSLRQAAAAVGTSLPQPVGAVAALLLVREVQALLGWSFGFAAGAMLALVVVELVPEALRSRGRAAGVAGTAAGVAGMVGLALWLGP